MSVCYIYVIYIYTRYICIFVIIYRYIQCIYIYTYIDTYLLYVYILYSYVDVDGSFLSKMKISQPWG